MRPKDKLARAARDNREFSEYWAGEAGPDAALEVLSGIMETIITLSGHPRAGVAAERHLTKKAADAQVLIVRSSSGAIRSFHKFR
jgi:plasmid stabilization system protein ParE